WKDETGWSYQAPFDGLDNDGFGSGTFSQTGTFSPLSTGFHDTSIVAAAGASSTATWQIPVDDTTQLTEVVVTWVPAPGRATNATYKIFDGATLLDTVAIDQTKPPIGADFLGGTFQKLATLPYGLGKFKFSSGTATVILDASNANGTVNADA